MAARIIAGVDVGGTYTDLFFYDPQARSFAVAKVPTTLHDQAQGIVEGVLAQGTALGDLATLVHGTTTATNALLERKGAPTGVIATEGFRDVLEMRRRDRPQTWGLTGAFEPIVPRHMRVEVAERTLADGTIRLAVDSQAVVEAAHGLVARGAEAIAVTFLHCYANDANERAAVEAIRAALPNLHVQASFEILPEIREFERASTTALNAYLQPVLTRYFRSLDASLRDRGFDGQLLIVQSNGGVMSIDDACRTPVRTALSGPAAGVIAAGRIAEAAGFPDVITGDMGGTSFDVSLVAGGAAALRAQASIDFGLVIRTPMIDIHTIGAGGGSIATVDGGGPAQGRPGLGRLRARPRLLRPGRSPRHRHRRQRAAGAHQRRAPHRRQARAPRCGSRLRGDPARRRRSSRPRRDGRRAGDRRRRQRADGRRHSPRLHREGARPARFRADALRRRRRAACRRPESAT